MIIEFLPQAKAELMDAAGYYEGELNGLGQRFWDEVDQHIVWIAENPEVPRLRDGGYRRVNLSVFPYYIAYIVRDPVIWILSIAHGRSLPEYWIDRA
jgi:plasmid stabilization system protein ParE